MSLTRSINGKEDVLQSRIIQLACKWRSEKPRRGGVASKLGRAAFCYLPAQLFSQAGHVSTELCDS